jgi:hypothetical protein
MFDVKPTDSALILSDGFNDKVIGTAGDDYIYTYDVGNDIVDGAGGVNTAIYKGLVADYKVTITGDGLTITELTSGSNQTDILKNVQQIKFANQDVVVDQAQSVLTLSANPSVTLGNSTASLAFKAQSVDQGVTVIYDLNSHLTDSIAGLYQICFDRLPDVDGIRFWESTLEYWGNDVQAMLKVAQSFLASDEYTDTHPDLNDQQFIDQLYLDAFERSADLEGRNYWLNDLANGAARDVILIGFAESIEMLRLVGQHSSFEGGFWAT